MTRALALALIAALSACGHSLRAGAGPVRDSQGRGGVEASVEVASHLIGARAAAMPVGVRGEVAVLSDGTVEGLVGIAFAVSLPPAGRRTRDAAGAEHGWGGRVSFASGARLGDGPGGVGARGGLALTHGTLAPGTGDGGGCHGADKRAWCHQWTRSRFTATGLELAGLWLIASDPMGAVSLEGWRVAAVLFHERGSVRDLELR